ncbi:MAG: GNAT family protein [Sedimentisphaerales bacterium]|jgi:RimJ/RimL family protein N-acetyltransferase
MRLVTKRLILRSPAIKDAADIAQNANDLTVLRYTAHVPFPYHIKDAKDFIKRCRKRERQKPVTDRDLVIELRTQRKVIGCTGFIRIDHYTGKADIGYWLGKNYWRQGLGSEAANALIKYAFTKLKLQRLEAAIYRENHVSQALVKKLGFRKEGVRRQASRSLATGKLHDVMIYGLLKSDTRL